MFATDRKHICKSLLKNIKQNQQTTAKNLEFKNANTDSQTYLQIKQKEMNTKSRKQEHDNIFGFQKKKTMHLRQHAF